MKKHFLFVLLIVCCMMLGSNHLSAQTFCSAPLDYQGYTYHLYRVGGNCWMRENLRATQYADGSDIPDTRYYNDDPSNLDTYGRLYTYYAATRTNPALPITQFTDSVQGVCPEGWHVSTQREWESLESSTGVAGFESLLSADQWLRPIGTSPADGFNFLPGGYYNSSNSRYERLMASGYYWTTTLGSTYPLVAGCHCNCPQITTESMVPSSGFSIRCVTYLRPEVTTSAVFDIGLNSAKCSGNVTFEGSSAVIARGICWNTSPNPTIENLHTTELPGSDPFIGSMNGLTSGTVYYVRAYATNDGGTSYGETFTFTTQSNTIPTCTAIPTVTDIEHNVYNTVKIGNQCWMKENLRTAKYADGTDIELAITTSFDNAYRYEPDGNSINISTYGYLYNWKAVMGNSVSSPSNPSGVQGVCPTGWHVPSDAEWTQLTNYVSSQSAYTCDGITTYIAKALAVTTGWTSYTSSCAVGNTPSTNNATGFAALPAGGYFGSPNNFGEFACLWSATEGNPAGGYYRNLGYTYADVGRYNSSKEHGFSVRCLIDPTLPTVTTAAVTNITNITATCGGEVTSDGNATVVRGVCWSTSPNPTISNDHTINGNGTGSFTSNITGLTANTTYYLRAYATNATGTSFGEVKTFTTLPSVTTGTVSGITATSATCGLTIGASSTPITAVGVCWSTSPNPTISNDHTINGNGTGSFTSNITGLAANTTYYVRAYATNSVGTSYGQQKSFTTLNCPSTLTDVDNNTYNVVRIGNQCWMKENLRTTKFADGTPIELGSNTSTVTPYRYSPNDDANNVNVYGYLYNWVAVMHGSVSSSSKPSGVQGICPTGWHLPSDGEWEDLMTTLGGNGVAGDKMKEAGTSHWLSGGTQASNSSGFTALAAGYYGSSNTGFGERTYYWSATERNATNAYTRYITYSASLVSRGNEYKHYGFSVRCLSN